jgi:hypothetical protein
VNTLHALRIATLTATLVTLTAVAPAVAQAGAPTDAQALARYKAAEAIAQSHLKTFDTLDFDVFSNQKWDRLKESHAATVAVHWPDGHVTTGIDRHISDLKAMFVYAPDTRIKQHPVRVAHGEWTAVTGVMEGTFTQPMPTPNGLIAPTGKSFKLPMATVSHWKNGAMDEEYLFWDNQTYMTQLGVGK